MNRFQDYTSETRGKALALLRERDGICVWNPTFDPNSEQVINVCEEIVNGPRSVLPKPLVPKEYNVFVEIPGTFPKQTTLAGTVKTDRKFEVWGKNGIEWKYTWTAYCRYTQEFWAECNESVAVFLVKKSAEHILYRRTRAEMF